MTTDAKSSDRSADLREGLKNSKKGTPAEVLAKLNDERPLSAKEIRTAEREGYGIHAAQYKPRPIPAEAGTVNVEGVAELPKSAVAAAAYESFPDRADEFDYNGNRERRWTFHNDRGETVESVRIDMPNGKPKRFTKPKDMRGPWLPLYHQHLDFAQPIVVCEGEKSTDAVWEAGHQATCWKGGASAKTAARKAAAWIVAQGCKQVVLWADNDEPGFAVMDAIKDSLHEPVQVASAVCGAMGSKKDAADINVKSRRMHIEDAIGQLVAPKAAEERAAVEKEHDDREADDASAEQGEGNGNSPFITEDELARHMEANGAAEAEPEDDGEEEPPKRTPNDRYMALGYDIGKLTALVKEAPRWFENPHNEESKIVKQFNSPEGRAAVLAAKRDMLRVSKNVYERKAGELVHAITEAISQFGEGDLPPLVYDPGRGDFGPTFAGSCYKCGEPSFKLGGWDKGRTWAKCGDCGIKIADVKADLLDKAKPESTEEDEGIKDTLEKLGRFDLEPGFATQIAFARSFQRKANGDWLHDDDAKQWWHWDGEKRVWRELTHKARDIMAAIIGAATHGDKKLAEKFQANTHVSGALTIASDRCYASMSKDFDANAMLVGLPDGMALNLATKKPMPRKAKRDDRLTQAISIVPAKGSIKQFTAFLNYAFGDYDDPAKIVKAVLWFIGDALRGLVNKNDSHGFLFLQGDSGTGKTTLANIVYRLFGSYATTINAARIVGKREDHLQWLNRLSRKRLIIAAELPNEPLKCEIVNAITAGDATEANAMRSASVDFQSKAHLIAHANHRPRVNSPGTFRRMRLIEMNRKPTEEDADLEDRLVAEEGAAILHEAIKVRAANKRPDWPDSIKAKVQEYERENDAVGMWLEENCKQEFGSLTPTRLAYANYEAWCKASGQRPMSKPNVSRKLAQKGIKVEPARATEGGKVERCYIGIEVLPGGAGVGAGVGMDMDDVPF